MPNNGIQQVISGLSPGADFVLRPVISYSMSAIPKVLVLDGTNGDAEITSITLPNLTTDFVANGGFDSDTGSWTASGSTLTSVAGGISGNCLQIENALGSFARYAYQIVQLIPYATYRITYWHKNGSGAGYFYLGPLLGTNSLYNSGTISDTGWVQRTSTFTTTATGLVYISAYESGSSVGNTTLFDSITLTRVLSPSKPWAESLALSLPTVAREGADATWVASHYVVANDCVAIKIQVVDSAGLGAVTSVHQLELI